VKFTRSKNPQENCTKIVSFSDFSHSFGDLMENNNKLEFLDSTTKLEGSFLSAKFFNK
jgi:hypothetical protein